MGIMMAKQHCKPNRFHVLKLCYKNTMYDNDNDGQTSLPAQQVPIMSETCDEWSYT